MFKRVPLGGRKKTLWPLKLKLQVVSSFLK